MCPTTRSVPLSLRLLHLALFGVLVACALTASASSAHEDAGRPRRAPRGIWDSVGEEEDEDAAAGSEDPLQGLGEDDDEEEDEDYADDDAGGGRKAGGDEDAVDEARVNVELTQYDYSDACAALADAQWKWLLAGEPGSGPEEALLWESEAAMGSTARKNVIFMQDYSDLREHVPKAPPVVLDELDYSLHAGDLLLSETAFMQKLNYSRAAQRALSDLRVPCEGGADPDCVMTLPVVRRVLARSGDAAQQLRAWRGAQEALRPLAAAFPAQLAHARAAAAANGVAPAEGEVAGENGEEGAGAVGAYWQLLQDPDEYLELTFARVRQLWQQVRPLHRKLVAFVRERLKAAYGEAALAVEGAPATDEEPLLPAHLTGSLVGDDWSALADLVFPSARLRDLDHALQEKGLKGRALYEAALHTLNVSLGIEDLPPRETMLRQVRYDGECPARVVQNCTNGAPRALACSTSGWQEYAEAHDVMTRLAHAHLGAEKDKEFLLRVVTRYSATHDMLAAAIRLLSLHPDRLQELDVLPDEEDYEDLTVEEEEATSSGEEDVRRGEATLRLLTALRVLPRLAYFAAGDAFRLRLLAAVAEANARALAPNVTANGTATNSSAVAVDPVALWAQVRREYMLVAAPPGEAGDAAWLADAALAGNVPLLGRFVAELLAFQSLEYLVSYDPAHPLPATRSDARIPVLMALGRSKRWSEILNEHMDINEIRAEPLLRYFKPLAPLLSPKLAAKAPAAAKRPAVDLTPPVPPPPAPPSAPAFVDPFLLPDVLSSEDPAAPPSSPAEPSGSAPAPYQEETGSAAGAGAGPASDAPAGASSTDGPALRAVGAAEEATARTAVLAASLAVFGAALLAGAIVGGRRLLTRRRYERNRRPDVATAPKVANGDVEAALPEEAQPANPAANES